MATASEEARRRRRQDEIARRPAMSPTSAAPAGQLRIATWNVNSLKARAAGLRELLERARPDVLCLQETKASAIAPVAADVLAELGYRVEHVGAGAYNGVAIASRHELTDVIAAGAFGDEHLDREPRLIAALVHAGDPFATPIRVVSVYVPHGREVGHWHYDYKLAFLRALAARVRRWIADGHVVVAGDVNVAPTDSDVFHPDAFEGLTHVTPEERAALAELLDAGLVDLDAARWGARERRFTYWSHGSWYAKNLGMRIDMIAADVALAERLVTTWIDHEGRGGERPSDHAALIADFA